jgi:hypothetical protein
VRGRWKRRGEREKRWERDKRRGRNEWESVAEWETGNAMTALSLKIVTEACLSVTHRGHIINNAPKFLDHEILVLKELSHRRRRVPRVGRFQIEGFMVT